MNLAWVKTKEILDSSLGIIGVFLGIWGLVLNWNSAVVTGACLILASHIFLKIWWLRFIEKAVIAGIGIFIGFTGHPMKDACIAILAFSTIGAVLTTIGNTMATLEDMEKSGELKNIAEELHK